MSNMLSITVEWLEPIGEPLEFTNLEVKCSDGVLETLRFAPEETSTREVQTSGICTIKDLMSNSDVEVVSDTCGEFVDVTEGNQQCDFYALGMNVGVPNFTGIGLAVFIAVILGVGLWKLQR